MKICTQIYLYGLGTSFLITVLGIIFSPCIQIDVPLALLSLIFLYGFFLCFAIVIQSYKHKNRFVTKYTSFVFMIAENTSKRVHILFGVMVLLLAVLCIFIIGGIGEYLGISPKHTKIFLYLALSLIACFFSSTYFSHWLDQTIQKRKILPDFHFGSKSATMIMYILYLVFTIAININFLGGSCMLKCAMEGSFMTFLAWDTIIKNWHYISDKKS